VNEIKCLFYNVYSLPVQTLQVAFIAAITQMRYVQL